MILVIPNHNKYCFHKQKFGRIFCSLFWQCRHYTLLEMRLLTLQILLMISIRLVQASTMTVLAPIATIIIHTPVVLVIISISISISSSNNNNKSIATPNAQHFGLVFLPFHFQKTRPSNIQVHGKNFWPARQSTVHTNCFPGNTRVFQRKRGRIRQHTRHRQHSRRRRRQTRQAQRHMDTERKFLAACDAQATRVEFCSPNSTSSRRWKTGMRMGKNSSERVKNLQRPGLELGMACTMMMKTTTMMTMAVTMDALWRWACASPSPLSWSPEVVQPFFGNSSYLA